MIFRKEQ